MQKNASGHTAWFSTQSLEKSLPKTTWQHGVLLHLTHKVHDCSVLPCAEGWQLSAKVQETESLSFTISIDLRLTPMAQVASWPGQCQCQKKYPCSHAVALMLTVAQRGVPAPVISSDDQVPATLPKVVDARAAEIARLQAEAQLLQWLQQLDRVNAANTLPQNSLQQTNLNSRDFYVYLLNVCQDPLEQDAYLQIQAMTSHQKLKGGWAKPRIITSDHAVGHLVYDQATPVDHEVLHLIESMSNPNKSQYYHRNNYVGQPEGRAGLIALEQAASTGRLYVNDEHAGVAGEPLRWGGPQPLTWQWQETSSGWRLSAQLADAQVQLCLNNPPLYLDAAQAVCGPVQTNGLSPAQLKVLLKAPVFQAQMLEKHQVQLLQHLGPLPPPPMLKALVPLQGITPLARLHLSPSAPADVARYGLIRAQLYFDYACYRAWWDGPATDVLIEREGQRFWLQRDAAAELAAVARLEALGLRVIEKNTFGLSAEAKDKQRWLEWADDDFALLRQAGFELVVAAALQHWISRADALQVQLEPEHCLDADEAATSPWFELSLGMEINGQRHNILPWLPELIAAVADCPVDEVSAQVQLPAFVYLRAPDAQGFVRVPTEPLRPWLAALLELVGERAHDFSAPHLKLSRMDALRTGAALGEGAVWAGAHALREVVQQLKGGAALSEVPAPAGVQASLRRYQQQGVNWLQFLRQHGLSGILADDMGLGKTLQTLVHIQLEKDAGRLTQPALIIAPVSLMGNWRRETERFCPQLRCLVLHGKERHEVASRMGEYDVVIAPYSLLQRDRERWLQARWHLVVLDEAQNIKNASTQAAQVVSELNTRHRLCLSGTPMENHLGEIWSLFHFLMPGFLGSQKRFAELFRKPIEQQGNAERMAQLRARVTPFMLRRTKAVVADELPPKIETVMRVELSGAQADLYETIRLGMEKTVREALNAKGLAQSQITILDALLKLRQVCCDPHLLKLEAAKKVKTSAKLEHLMELLPEMLAEGRRVLLFSQFTSMLTLIEAELEKRHIPWVKLTGQSQQRDALIEQFTSGQVPLFLISLKAGGVGLNLPQADTVIHYDPWWNPAVENQATDRAHRIGQKQSVWVLKLVAQGTIEERILALQERKADLAQRMYSGAVGRNEPLFGEDDLAELLKPLSP